MTNAKAAVERVHPPEWLMRIANPVMKRLVKRGGGRLATQLLVLEFRGRRTGRTFTIPVGYRMIDGRRAILTNSRWRHNFRGGADVGVVIDGRPVPARAELLSDPGAVAELYDRLIGEIGWQTAGRQLGIRINAGRRPTRDELEDMVRRSGLSVVWLDPKE